MRILFHKICQTRKKIYCRIAQWLQGAFLCSSGSWGPGILLDEAGNVIE